MSYADDLHQQALTAATDETARRGRQVLAAFADPAVDTQAFGSILRRLSSYLDSLSPDEQCASAPTLLAVFTGELYGRKADAGELRPGPAQPLEPPNSETTGDAGSEGTTDGH